MTARRVRLGASCFMVAGLAVSAMCLMGIWRMHRDAVAIASLMAGNDAAVAPQAGPEVRAARARYLMARGDLAGAQAIVDGMANDGDLRLRASVLLALGNAQMRHAYGLISKLPFWKVRPVIALAKTQYRQAVQLDPDNWDARYNYAIAASLVHDQDQAKPTTGDEMSHERAAWPDIPGAPNGMP